MVYQDGGGGRPCVTGEATEFVGAAICVTR
jgi:hypothetical protein